MLPSSVLIVSDDTEFARTLAARWQAERHVPEITFATGSVWHPASASNHDLVIVGPVRDARSEPARDSFRCERIHRAPRRSISLKKRRASRSCAPNIRICWWCRGPTAGPARSSWSRSKRCAASKPRGARSAPKRWRFMAQGHATLGRYMLEMRPSVNNALTSVIGNADLLLLEPGPALRRRAASRSRRFTPWRCGSTKSCSDSHRWRAKCGPVRKNLKLRRRPRPTRLRRGP